MSNYSLNESFSFIAIISTATSINESGSGGGGGVNLSEIGGTSSKVGVNETTSLSESSLKTNIIVTIFYVGIFIIGVLGNIITCIVISRNKSMHTATNYYLTSLAVSDLLLIFAGLPFEVYTLWTAPGHYPFDKTMCIVQSSISEISANASVLTITAFTIERYVAICKPFLTHTMSKLSRAVKLILVIWVLAVVLSILPAMEMGIHTNKGQHFCTILDPKKASKTFTVSVILVFFLPLIVISFLYILIALQLRKPKIDNRGGPSGSSVRLKHRVFKKPHRTIVQVENDLTLPFNDSPSGSIHYSVAVAVQDPGLHHHHHHQTSARASPLLMAAVRNNNHSQQLEQALSPEDGRINFPANKTQSTRRVVNMLVAVVVAFFLCWGFHHSQRLFAVYSSASEQQYSLTVQKFYYYLTNVSGVFYYFSTCVNPILYNLMSNKFRMAFKATLDHYVHGGDEREFWLKRYEPHNVSHNSNSFRSQSINTCSTVVSTTQPQRYPLVVSFRKLPPNPPLLNERYNQIRPRTQTLDMDYLQQAGRFSVNETYNPIYENKIGERMYNESEADIPEYYRKLYGSSNTKHQIYKHKRINNSPYDSPEMTQDSLILEENLNHILKEVVYKPNDRQTNNVILKSRSVPSFFQNG